MNRWETAPVDGGIPMDAQIEEAYERHAELLREADRDAALVALRCFLLARFAEECAFLTRMGQPCPGGAWGRITAYVGQIAEWYPTFAAGEPCADCVREALTEQGLPPVLRTLATVMGANAK